MNTPAHLIVGASFFARSDRKGTLLAALAGAMAPDLSLYLMVGVSIWVMGIAPQIVFRDYYYSDAWQSVFAVDNSFILWSTLLCLALWRSWPRVVAFAGAGLLHLALDFPLHTHDARMHFWPLTDWVFFSPVSYWDVRAYAGIVGPTEFLFSLGCAVVLWRRFRDLWVRVGVGVLMVLETLSTSVWQFIF